MNDQNYNEIPNNDGWNDVPAQPINPTEPIIPEQPVSPAEPVIPEQPVSPVEPIIPEQSTEPEEIAQEPEIVEPITVNEVVPEVVFQSEPDPIQSQPFVYDPVLDESEPYIDVTPNNEGFQSAPSVDSSSSVTPPVDKKKNTGWTIALIVLLILCLCICCVAVIVSIMVASGEYKFEWSFLISPIISALRFL